MSGQSRSPSASTLTGGRRAKRLASIAFWRVVNPPTRLLAGLVPWWVLVETVGRRSGKNRRTPVATGTRDDRGMWLIAAHGRHASWVRNLEATPTVRVRVRRRWRAGVARVHDIDEARVSSFNIYARQAAGAMAIEPVLVRIDWAPAGEPVR